MRVSRPSRHAAALSTRLRILRPSIG